MVVHVTRLCLLLFIVGVAHSLHNFLPQPTTTAPPSGDETNRQMMEAVVARNQALDQLFADGGNPEMWTALVCTGLHNIVPNCTNVLPMDQMQAFADIPTVESPPPPPQGEANSRKRRHSSWSWGSWHWGGSSSNPQCPDVIDQSGVYLLNPDSSFYPAANIGTELSLPTNQEIRGCLFRTLTLPGDPPIVVREPFRDTAYPTCPYNQLRVWSYLSQTIGGQCFVLANFQEAVLYSECTEERCQGCKDRSYFRQNLCIPDFRTVSVWSYCPTLPPGARIILDRIVIPYACTCQSVRCDGFTGKK